MPSDGELSIKEVVAAHEVQLFDFMALTDHDFLVRPNCYSKINRLRTDLIIFKGIELTVFEKGYVHVNRITGDKEVLHIFNHPAELDLPLCKVKERIAGVASRLPIDAIEITSKGFRTPDKGGLGHLKDFTVTWSPIGR